MNPIVFALRKPVTVLVAVLAVFLSGIAVLGRMSVDVFPNLNLPVIYVCQPYGGMDPAQMEGLLTNYYEYHFLYINGIHHVESRNIQGMALMKLVFHPGTNMAQAMGETIAYVTRSRAFMPPGTVSPFVTRFDVGSVPVGYLVMSSESKTIGEIQDQALFKVRPMFTGLPGVSAPPPFGGSQRTVVIKLDPERLRATGASPDEIVKALSSGNVISPSGTVRFEDSMPIVPVNSLVKDVKELGDIPIRLGASPTVFLRDVAKIEDSSDIPVGYAMVNGRRAVYILVTKRADASTLAVVETVKAALPSMRDVLPEDIKVGFEFDQSPTVLRAAQGLLQEALLGAGLIGLTVLVFLRDWRSVIIVVLNIPFAIAGAVVALWATGQTINLMTLSGLALAVGILVDEATVEIENIHAKLSKTSSVSLAVRQGNMDTAVPRFLAMLCILAVFLPTGFMKGSAQALFVPTAFAVGFSMISSYLLSSTFVPVMSAWLLKSRGHARDAERSDSLGILGRLHAGLLRPILALRFLAVPSYFAVCAFAVFAVGRDLAIEIFPRVDAGRFQLRFRAPTGTRVEAAERIANDVLSEIRREVGPENLELSIGYVGLIPSSYPINAIYQWSGGPEEGFFRVALKDGERTDIEALKARLRSVLAENLPDVRFSFEPADIVSDVMSFGSLTPIEVHVSGPNLADSKAYAEKVRVELSKLPELADLQYAQAGDYPTVNVRIDREKAGLAGVTIEEISRSLVAATSSSRFVTPNYWPDPKSGIGYQVQVEIPFALIGSIRDVESIPVKRAVNGKGAPLLLRDVAEVSASVMPGQFDRYNMKRVVGLTATIAGSDLGRAATAVENAIKLAGERPKGVTVELRGQIAPLREILEGLRFGLAFAIVVMFLMLWANFQSLRAAIVALSTVPAVIVGVAVALYLSRTTINIQSFMGTIMAAGVSVANAILMVTFAERARKAGASGRDAGLEGARGRLRPILMTAIAMIAGMTPLALGLGEGGEQTAPLGRAVIGGLVASTIATLFILPAVFATLLGSASRRSVSLDPFDPESDRYVKETDDVSESDRNGSGEARHSLLSAKSRESETVS